MKQKTIIWILAILLVILVVFIITSGRGEAPSELGESNGSNSEIVENDDNDYDDYAEDNVDEFKESLEEKVVARSGQPIEGFVPQMFLAEFSELMERDFDGVEASIGHYKYRNNELVHDLEGETLVHSAADTVTEDGYKTLLENVMKRLNFMTNDHIKAIIARLEGRVENETGNGNRPPVPPPVNDDEVVCTDEMKQAEACTMEYAPVCGLVQVQCITTPCDPVPETFGNGCSACAQGNVVSYTEGECSLQER